MFSAKIKCWLHTMGLLIAGGLLPFSFAPYGIWPLACVSTTLFYLLLQTPNNRRFIYPSFIFALGMFGHGASWVYISIHDFGFTGVPLAIVLTIIFVVFLALVFSLPFYVLSRIGKRSTAVFAFAFTALWVIGEWLRSWLFTGFPWLYVGYAHIDSPLSALAPVGGVFSLSFISILMAICLWRLACMAILATGLFSKEKPTASSLTFPILTLCVCGMSVSLSTNREWTQPSSPPQQLSILQPNVELMRKWDPLFFPGIIEELDEAADLHWQSDIQLWPEAAIPSVYHEIQNYLDDVEERAKANQTNVISGVLYDRPEPYEIYNSIVGLGSASGIYFKQKLVPFGEYVPLERYLRGVIAFFDLPNSVIRRGPFRANAISALTRSGHQYIVAPFICYEVVYPDFVSVNARAAELLVTISNDAWFGNSIGPHQHLEMVRMRALENQKYFARSTNTGISAIINERGKILARGEQFARIVVNGEVELRQGLTPFARFGSWPTLVICLSVLAFAYIRSRSSN